MFILTNLKRLQFEFCLVWILSNVKGYTRRSNELPGKNGKDIENFIRLFVYS
jgi:hypothetical protein